MTSGVCHPGEPQPKTNQPASRALPAGKIPPRQQQQQQQQRAVEQIKPIVNLTIVHNEAGQEILIDQRKHREHQQKKRVSSGSSDSGQLSSLSSYGSLSLGGYQNKISINRCATSNESVSRQSVSVVDIDQHQYYCSLMLLNSLDFYHHERNDWDAQLSLTADPQHKSSISSNNLSNTLNFASCGGNLQDCRAHRLHRNHVVEDVLKRTSKQRQQEETVIKEISVPVEKEVKTCEFEENKEKKKSRSLNLFGGNWRGQGADKLVAVAAVASNSASFVDKFLTHMVKRGGTGKINRSATAPSSVKGAKVPKQSKMDKSPIKKNPSTPDKKKQETTQSGSNIYMLNDQDLKSTSSKKKDSSSLKPKTSLLTRARNSTINLASLATVTNRFSCSASVGNLWHYGQHGGNQNELADGATTDGIQPIDYVTTGPFDSYQPNDGCEQMTPKEPKTIKSVASNKLLGVASLGSSRKLSTKEKSKRQKDAERVEKLRLLVSYLRSGSSQPMVNPITLEADDIELAERYKLHMILRDDLIREKQDCDQKQQGQILMRGNIEAPDGIDDIGFKDVVNDVNNIRLNSHSIGEATTLSPTTSSSGSINHAHSTNGGRSNPHIGSVTWVLRHSISDPGNNFEHSPAFSSSSSSHNHPSRDVRQHHHFNHQDGVIADHVPPFGDSAAHNNSEYINCESCAHSSSYSGCSLNNYCSAPTINKETVKQQTSNQHKSPKLFYIDDMDHIPIAVPNCQMLTPSTPATSGISQLSSSSALSSAPSSSYSQPPTPAISTASSNGDSIRKSSQTSASAWSNPPNLATWIDNEVNSLVHDLEAKSQELLNKGESKYNKGGKKKWLSVTSGTIRRNSSGAQST